VRGAILGIGGDLKSAPALARGRDVHLSPFLGDLDEEESMDWFKSEVKELLDINGGKVGLVVHDLHPLYRSTMWAERQGFGQRIAIQHHFAHILSVMAEHGLEEAIGLSFDGTGYGTDGTIWGGEFLRATRSGFSRLGSFRPFPLPGGEAAVLHPPRIALAMLSDPTRKSLAPVPSIPGLTPEERQIVLAMVEKGLNTPLTSSLGRIFDAAAAILGLLERTSYEGEGPMLLEGAALSELSGKSRAGDFPAARELLPFSEARCGGHFLIDAAPLLSYLLQERERKNVGELALAFHLLMARASLSGAERMRDLTGIMDIALSGGVFQNLHLRELLVPLLTEQGFRVFLNRAVPPGDGGLSLGQVYYVP
jgi:hydrogenase maturation protein HypF